jgi:TPR repeat protein
MLYRGEGGQVDMEEARRLYGLAAAAGNAKAQYNLGLMFKNADGGPADLQEARRLFDLAAAQKLKQAQYSLGLVHEEAEDLEEARRLYGLAAEQGHANAKDALVRLREKTVVRHVSETSDEVASSEEDAARYYRLAHDLHHGKGQPQDWVEARRLYGLAADQGHASSQTRLSTMHSTI